MFESLSALGPLAVFLGVTVIGLFTSIIVATLATRQIVNRLDSASSAAKSKNYTWFLLWFGNFLLWGGIGASSTATEGGGRLAYTHGGVLQYVTVTSVEVNNGAAWTHELALNPVPLILTVALSLALFLIVSLIIRLRRPVGYA